MIKRELKNGDMEQLKTSETITDGLKQYKERFSTRDPKRGMFRDYK